MARTLLLTAEDDAALNSLARRRGCSVAAAVRRLIQEEAAEMSVAPASGVSDRSAVPSPARERRHVDRETLRKAAEQAREYYATDPEAREWTESQPVFGSCRGKLTTVAEDEEHLEAFNEYGPRGCRHQHDHA